MDQRLLQFYNQELEFMQDMGEEFARANPKIAGRLGIEKGECADPYVERLLEGFAFLAARVHLKIEEEFPKFCQQLISMVYPEYLAPLPSMTVVQINPEDSDSGAAEGFVLDRGTVLRSGLNADMQTACEYRTAHPVTLLPVRVTAAEYIANRASLAKLGVKPGREVRAGIRIRFSTLEGVDVSELNLDSLPVYIAGGSHHPQWLYEQLLNDSCDISVICRSNGEKRVATLGKRAVRSLGFERENALLTHGATSFDGYRLLKEYFAFPERFHFVNFTGLSAALRTAEGREFEIVVELSKRRKELEDVVEAENFRLFCTPAVNLFPKRADRIHLDEANVEYHVVPDRSKPLDFEVYQVLGVTGYGDRAHDKQEFLPFYGMSSARDSDDEDAFFTVQRKSRVPSSGRVRTGQGRGHTGQEVFVSIVDSSEAPYRSDIRQLGVMTLCTNRNLPRKMPLGEKNGDFSLEVNAPVESIRCVAGPTQPGSGGSLEKNDDFIVSGDYAWRVISHFSLNYLTLIDQSPEEGAAALRELLGLYANYGSLADRYVNAILNVTARPVTRRLPIPGPISFGRGLEISVVLDEAAFEGRGMYLFGAVLREFFAKYVSLNNVTETVIKNDRGVEIARWPVRIGTRPTL